MNRIVRRHYPASKLPAELRVGMSPEVTVEVEAEAELEKPMPLEELFAMARPTFSSVEEVVAHVRAMRDEWD